MTGVVVVTTRSFGSGDADPEGLLASHGLKVVRGDPYHDLGKLAEQLADAVAWIAGVAPITVTHLDQAPNLRLIARYGTGVDAIDLDACNTRGVLVTNTPGANADAVAEHAIGLALVALRHVLEGDSAVRDGAWPSLRGRELGRLHIGIVGFGQIGRRVATLARCFGATVSAYDPHVADAAVRDDGVIPVPLAVLVGSADVVSLHRPAGVTPLVDEGFLERLRPGAVLVNTARAGLVDENAVAAALQNGRLAAYASDVSRLGDSAPLAAAPNTVLTPHIGAETTQAIDRMGMTAAEEVIGVLVHDEQPRHPAQPASP